MTEQYIGCQNSDVIVCDDINKKCCVPIRDIFLIVDLEKRINNELVLKTYFDYKDERTGGEEPHPDFLVVREIKDKNNKPLLVLEIMEFKVASHEESIKHGIALQLLYFYCRVKELLEKRLNLYSFSNIENVELLIVVPPDRVGIVLDILEKLKTNPDESLSFLFKRSEDKRKKLEKVRRLIISTGGRILDRIKVKPCVQVNNNY